MTGLEYNCPKCQETYRITENYTNSSEGSVPLPDSSIFKRKFQDHGDHTIFLDVVDQELKDFQIVPQLRSVYDTFLFDNIEVAGIINTLLANKNRQERSLLLYVTNHHSYSKFFKEISKIYLQSNTNTIIKQQQGSMIISLSHLDFVLADIERAKKVVRKGISSLYSHASLQPSKLVSLLIDTSIFEESILLKQIKKGKWNLSPDVKLILAFDSRKTKQAPLDIREYFMDKFDLKSMELLNYQDTNGLKSIFLQSYYNLLQNPREGREAFEIMQRQY